MRPVGAAVKKSRPPEWKEAIPNATITAVAFIGLPDAKQGNECWPGSVRRRRFQPAHGKGDSEISRRKGGAVSLSAGLQFPGIRFLQGRRESETIGAEGET